MQAANSHLSIGDKWSAYNNPARWGDSGIWNRPIFNLNRFQKKINRLIGTADGKPIVRAVWAWDVNRWECGEMRKAYRFYTAKFPNGDTCDLSPPRWMMEERIEPGQYLPNWEQVRYIRRQIDVKLIGVDDLGEPIYEPVYETIDSTGPPPVGGMYSYLYTIADHDPNNGCCDRAIRDWKNGKRATRRCWGYYRKPGDKDLQILQEAKRQRDTNPYKQSPHEPLSAETLKEIAILEKSWNEGQHKRRRDDAQALWADHFNTWGYRLDTDDPALLKHGKFKFMPQHHFTERESGLIVPDQSLSKG